MNIIAKIFLAIGFFLSIATNYFLLSIFLAYFAIYTYSVSIGLRGLGWIISYKTVNKFNIFTGVVVLVLGLAIFIGGVSTLEMLITLWCIYTVIEAITYFRMRRLTKLYLPAMVSLISVALVILYVISGTILQGNAPEEFIPNFVAVYIFNMISAFFAAIASLKATAPKQESVEEVTV